MQDPANATLVKAFDALDEHIAVLDPEGEIVLVNEAWKRFARQNGAPHYDAIGSNYLAVLEAADGEGAYDAQRCKQGLKQVLVGSLARFRMEYSCNSPTEERWFLMTATRLGEGEGVVVSHVNITDRKQYEALIAHQANYDALTGLANRRFFYEQAGTMLAQAKRSETALAVVFIDLDDFKSFNDTYGHQVGDALLKEVAERLHKQSRASDFLTRFGGDEFVLLLYGVDSERCLRVLERHQRCLNEPYALAGKMHAIKSSFGAACFPTHAQALERLIQLADLAMYQAKGAGGGIRLHCVESPVGAQS